MLCMYYTVESESERQYGMPGWHHADAGTDIIFRQCEYLTFKVCAHTPNGEYGTHVAR